MLLLNDLDIARLAHVDRAMAALRGLLLEESAESLVVPQRMIVDNQEHGALSLVMPALARRAGLLGVKVSSIHPRNRLRALPTVNGLMILLDSATGQVAALIDSAGLTALRTSVVSALATDLLAPRDARTLAIVGSGAQARAHLLTLCAIRRFDSVTVCGRSRASVADFVATMSGKVPCRLDAVPTLAEAVASADVICMTTSHADATPLLVPGHVHNTAHITAIGGSTVHACECDPAILSSARVYVDDIAGALRESGEIAAAIEHGYTSADRIADLKALLQEGIPPAARTGLTYFRGVGHASQDLAIAGYLVQRAAQTGEGQHLAYFEGAR
jgi:ornithine cyclodeaminase/alanine dehydrogenase-like protein (mu-crystallin family)